MKKLLFALLILISPAVFADCIGYSGPGGPCSTGPGGGMSTGPGNNWRRVGGQ